MRIAGHLGMSLQRCQQEHTSREYIKWLTFLDEQEVDHFNRTEYYLAQIALEVRRSINPKRKWKLKDFMLSFKKDQPLSAIGTDPESVEEVRRFNAAKSKAAWLPAVGFANNRKK